MYVYIYCMCVACVVCVCGGGGQYVGLCASFRTGGLEGANNGFAVMSGMPAWKKNAKKKKGLDYHKGIGCKDIFRDISSLLKACIQLVSHIIWFTGIFSLSARKISLIIRVVI
jgi:hypothetical protein